ncbi:FitA-like ribbon-helix-helix domain-containing protein [Dinoroseobacter sp. S124A]|uniref:FitA-like ribbon-helix-helix domain-containing protein n=1 Tax=Dinoroseobacter sp. S124A TaxID=3415128 RepID=UPI003C7D87BC
MATLTVRNIEPELHNFLRQEAARHGRSMEAEVRALLRARMAAEGRSPRDVAAAIRSRFAGLEGGIPLPDRPSLPDPMDLAG